MTTIRPRIPAEHPLITAARALTEEIRAGGGVVDGAIIIVVREGVPAEVKIRPHEKSLARKFKQAQE